jgi:hypothetical protein
MNNPAAILEIFQLGLLVKLFYLVLTLFYFVFTAVVFRQIILMTQVLDSKISPYVRIIAVGQMIVVAILFFLGLLLA